MPQHVLHHLHVDPSGQRDRRGAVAEVMKSDRGQPGLPGQEPEMVGDIRRMQRTAIHLGEHQPRLNPPVASRLPLLVLLNPMRTQHQDRVHVQRHTRRRLISLRRPHPGLPPVLDQLVEHIQRTSVQMRVLPPLTTRLTPPHTPMSNQVIQPVQPVMHRVIEEDTQLWASECASASAHRGRSCDL
jgi:hypothetical protein